MHPHLVLAPRKYFGDELECMGIIGHQIYVKIKSKRVVCSCKAECNSSVVLELQQHTYLIWTVPLSSSNTVLYWDTYAIDALNVV